MKKYQRRQTAFSLIDSAAWQQVLGQDDRRVYAGFFTPPTVQTVYITSDPAATLGFSGAPPVLMTATQNGPVWELSQLIHKELVQLDWYATGTGMVGTAMFTVIELLEWDDSRDDGILLPSFAVDPHTLRTGIDVPDRMQQLVSDLLRLRQR